MQWKPEEYQGQNSLWPEPPTLGESTWDDANLALVMFNNLNQTLELLVVKSICCLLSLGESIKPGVNVDHSHGSILFHIEFEGEPFDRFDEAN